jgi:hypothetical protein
LSNEFVTVHVGAKPHQGGWALVDAATVAANRDIVMVIAFSASKVDSFQRMIYMKWMRFNSARPDAWAMDKTMGRSFTSASFAMKALQTGFDAIAEPLPAYSGVRFKDFQVEDIFGYLGARLSQAKRSPAHDWTMEFIQLPPKPFATEDAPLISDKRKIPVIRSSKPHKGRFAYANDAHTSLANGGVGKIPFERVIGYGFRGDDRTPSAIRDDFRGFLPNYTRPDHIADAKTNALPDDQALDLAEFLRDQKYGGYISTSKSYATAKYFATQRGVHGWVYVCFVEGAFHIPPEGRPMGVRVRNDEQELAMPGMLDWEDVVGFREVKTSGAFTGDIFLRPSLRSEEPPSVFTTLWNLLSGKSQG